MQADNPKADATVYRAHGLFVLLFYALLVLWTVGTVPPVYRRFEQGGFSGDWLFAFMIGFFYLFTWYWSLGLFHTISLDAEGTVVMKSLRRQVELPAKQIRAIDGSRFASGFGFVRFKLPRESGYLFCHGMDGDLKRIIGGIRKENPLLKAVRV